MSIRLLLGPQRPVANIAAAMDEAGLSAAPVAVVSAGWQEAEGDIDDVSEVTARPVFDLGLYRRAEQVFAHDAGLQAAYRERQDRLQALQRLYALRLRHTMAAARQMLRATADASLVSPEIRHAISQLRALDRHHRRRVEKIHARFAERYSVDSHELLEAHQREIAALLERCDTVVITGGNVAVLVNRLRLFGLDALLSQKHVVAWSAGAMALSDTVVLYHDKTPQGRRNAEVFGPGLDLVPGCVMLPDARRRLRTSNRLRLALFCRRFAPAACVTLDSGAQLLLANGVLQSSAGARQIADDGRLRKVRFA